MPFPASNTYVLSHVLLCSEEKDTYAETFEHGVDSVRDTDTDGFFVSDSSSEFQQTKLAQNEKRERPVRPHILTRYELARYESAFVVAVVHHYIVPGTRGGKCGLGSKSHGYIVQGEGNYG